MALDIWIWITAIVTAGFSIFITFLLYWIVIPARGSFARHVIKARRDNKPIFFLDNGKFFRCVIGEDKQSSASTEVYRDKDGKNIIKGGQGMKYCEGVLMGIAEDFRSLTVNIGILDLLEGIVAKKWDGTELEERLNKLTEKLKQDLGVTDEFKDLEDRRKASLDKLVKTFDAQRAEIIKLHKITEAEDHGIPEKPE